jgi:hypothetical protein
LPFVAGERDRDLLVAPFAAFNGVGEGRRFSAAVEGLISCSSSESEEGKNRSGSLFNRLEATGEGEGEKSIIDELVQWFQSFGRSLPAY